MSVGDAWRVGVPFGLGLFVLSLLSTVPYFIPSLSDAALARLSDGVALVAFLAFLEAGRRVGRAAGAPYGALGAGVAGFLAALAGVLQHALLHASPAYGRFVLHTYGRAAYAAAVRDAGGVAAMAGIFGSLIGTTLLGALLGLVGGFLGALAAPRRPRPQPGA